jgi:hypothetical protein
MKSISDKTRFQASVPETGAVVAPKRKTYPSTMRLA